MAEAPGLGCFAVKRQFAVLLFAFFAVTAPAHAALTVTISTTEAGKAADVTLNATFATTPSSVTVHFPPGLVGDPSGPKCTQAAFLADACPAETRVGQATAHARILGLPIDSGGTVYNLVPNDGEPARLGIVNTAVGLFPLSHNQASVSLRPDGGLDSTIATLDSGGFDLTGLDLTLERTFMTLPTSCGEKTITLNGESDTFTTTNCEAVPFTPGVSASLETTQRSKPTGATVTLTLPEGDSHVRRTDIVLPLGTTLSPGVADGLQACTQAQFDGAGCPAGAAVGTVSFVTPLLGNVPGTVYFGDGFRLYVVVENAQRGVKVQLAGDTRLDPGTGQITTSFDNLPQVPFTSFALSFKGGPHAVLANPTTCGTKQLDATLTPWSGTAAKQASATFTIDQGCGLPFAPALAVGATSTAAGRPAGAVTMAVSRSDADQNITGMTVHLPPGLAGSLKGVPVCSDAQADAGACPPETRVGSVEALAGSGDAPVALTGTVSLTGPTNGGLAGLAIALPGRVGPVDLGTVVTRAGILLRPDGGLSVKTRRLPQIVGGVPVSIRRLALTLDRPGFILNASSCAAQQVTADLTGDAGASATVAAPYQATDCAGLPFKPTLRATLGARNRTKAGSFAPLTAVITVPARNASTAVADVALPSVLVLDIKRAQRACRPDQNPCKASSRIGTAIATTPLLAAPLTSPVTLKIPKLGELPGLSLTLTGPVTLPLFGKVDPFAADHRVRNSFARIPDVPLERFELAFNTRNPLMIKKDVCHGARQRVTASLTAHSGVKVNLRTPLKIAGCPPKVTLKKGRLKVKPGRDGAKVKTVKLGKKKVKASQRVKVKRSKRYKVTVTDAAKQTWKIRVRAR
jgi:hypothetical protein